MGLEAGGHLWENLEAALTRLGYRVVVLNPLQVRRYREVVRTKAKTDDLDAYLIAGPGPVRSGQAQGSYLPDELVQSLRELARPPAGPADAGAPGLPQKVALPSLPAVVFPEHGDVLGEPTTVRAQAVLMAFPTARHLARATPEQILKVAQEAGAQLLESIPGIRRKTAALLLGELGGLRRFHSTKALGSWLPDSLERITMYPDEQSITSGGGQRSRLTANLTTPR